MWKELVAVYFKSLFRHFLEGLRKTMENLSQYLRPPKISLNAGTATLSDSRQGHWFFDLPLHPDSLWGPPSTLSEGSRW